MAHSSVTVETKKLAKECGMGFCKCKHVIVFILIILNTLLLLCILCQQQRIEAAKVGGSANYKLVKQIYKSPTFKAQQKTQIEQALQMYTQGASATTPTVSTETQPATTEMPTIETQPTK